MPTNLPPDYFAAEERLRKARTSEERIASLEEMMSIVPKHKGTEHLRADLKRRLAELRTEQPSQKGGGRQVSPFHIDTEGAGQVTLVGMPNVGKSSLVVAFTNAKPEVGAQPFTTWNPTPGMMPIEDIQVQLVDTPPLNREFIKPGMMDLIRRSDLLLVVVDIQGYPLQELDDAVAILDEHCIVPASFRDRYPDRYDLTFVPALVAVNKCDNPGFDEDYEILRELADGAWQMVPVSATTGYHLDEFKRAIYTRLDIIRVYGKPPGREADLSAPFVLRKGGTVEEFAAAVHQDFVKHLKSARVWGEGVFDGQIVSREHILHDGDIVELRT